MASVHQSICKVDSFEGHIIHSEIALACRAARVMYGFQLYLHEKRQPLGFGVKMDKACLKLVHHEVHHCQDEIISEMSPATPVDWQFWQAHTSNIAKE